MFVLYENTAAAKIFSLEDIKSQLYLYERGREEGADTGRTQDRFQELLIFFYHGFCSWDSSQIFKFAQQVPVSTLEYLIWKLRYQLGASKFTRYHNRRFDKCLKPSNKKGSKMLIISIYKILTLSQHIPPQNPPVSFQASQNPATQLAPIPRGPER